MDTALFILGLLSLLGTLAALCNIRRLGWFVPVYFMASWLQGEMAPLHLIVQGGLAALLVAAGALDSGTGQWGLILLLASAVGLVWIIFRSRAARHVYQQALNHGLGPDYLQDLPVERRLLQGDEISSDAWLMPNCISN